MKIRGTVRAVSLAAVLAMVLVACGGGGGGSTETSSPSGGGGGLNLTTQGEQLAFNPATLTAKAGDQVTVSFKNGSSAQKHNWVLVKGGDDVAQKVDEAAAAGGGETQAGGDVIAATKLLAGGETGTASFTAPAAGTYTFLCTFPGHFVAGMKGTLTVS